MLANEQEAILATEEGIAIQINVKLGRKVFKPDNHAIKLGVDYQLNTNAPSTTGAISPKGYVSLIKANKCGAWFQTKSPIAKS